MSQAKRQAADDAGFTDSDVASYLRSHPDFFERHLPLLRRLHIPHQSGTSTVSLVERQVTVLRQRNDELERQLTELVDVARANNELVDKIHELAMTFLRTTGIEARLAALENALREDFGAERAVLVLFADKARPGVSREGFLKIVDRKDDSVKSFSTFLRSARARCGPLRDKQKMFLFGREADSIASGAMVPIGAGSEVGFLTVGSKDANQFHPGQRVDFLAQLGELVELALKDSDDADVRS
jgi:uncharacterized protein YigA (DUF484 family)